MRRTSVVYCIENVVTGKKYVGSAKRGLADRKYFHLLQLKAGKHHSRYLQRSWNKHGAECFKFYVLEKVGQGVAKELLLAREQHWMDTLKVCDVNHGYNISPKAGSNEGASFYKTEDFRNKQRLRGKRANLFGRKISISARINQGRTQSKLTDEQANEIRRLSKAGMRQRAIAKQFGVCQQSVSNIVRKRGLVYGGISRIDYRPNPKAPITASEVARVKELFATGMQQRKIAKEIGRSNSAVNRIVLGH